MTKQLLEGYIHLKYNCDCKCHNTSDGQKIMHCTPCCDNNITEDSWHIEQIRDKFGDQVLYYNIKKIINILSTYLVSRGQQHLVLDPVLGISETPALGHLHIISKTGLDIVLSYRTINAIKKAQVANSIHKAELALAIGGRDVFMELATNLLISSHYDGSFTRIIYSESGKALLEYLKEQKII